MKKPQSFYPWDPATLSPTNTLAMAQHPDPMVRAVKKAYANSLTGKMGKLMEQRSRWLRKQTIATNKLAEVEAELRKMLAELIVEKEGMKKE